MGLDNPAWGLDADELMELKQRVLNLQRQFLCTYLDFGNHFIFLRSCEILSERDVEFIQAATSRKDRVDEMVNRLLRGREDSLDALCASIEENGTQPFVVERLKRAYGELVEKAIEQKTTATQCPQFQDFTQNIADPRGFNGDARTRQMPGCGLQFAWMSTTQFHAALTRLAQQNANYSVNNREMNWGPNSDLTTTRLQWAEMKTNGSVVL
ncbi:hypothetical protein CAPTEDRAFT_189674 [Capitella teleta]|uniref:CARD domain-containing protein n=1 Tax=Capitella teleta TaxID=283909 RepID=R7TS71_CAPTE|nr:hypothetical protein CAPTEDRAFT_189674 [Capitella teleta]|eukprot:ELT94316.1 hypothetical protein CAPTEDRAFT_189674 [Capitella teleta]